MIVLVIGFLIFGIGSNNNSGGGYATDLTPVAPDEDVDGVSVDPTWRDTPKKYLPPESTLSFRGDSVVSAGEILGMWEPEGLLAPSNGGWARSRTDSYLALSDGHLLKVPADSELRFVYGGKPGTIDFLDAMAFRVENGELEYGEDVGTLSVDADRGPARPVVLPLSTPEPASWKRVGLRTELSPGVYVISVAVAASEGGVRYNFRISVEN